MKAKLLKQKNAPSTTVEDKRTGPIILLGSFPPPWEGGGGGGGPTFPGNDPFPGGDPGGGGAGGGCSGYGDWMTGQVTVADELISETTNNIDATHRTIAYTWTPFKQVANIYSFESRDIATQQLISGSWVFTALSHQSVTLTGITTGFTLQWFDYIAPTTSVTSSVATVTLNFRVRQVFYCGGAPFEWNLKFADGSINGYAQHHFYV